MSAADPRCAPGAPRGSAAPRGRSRVEPQHLQRRDETVAPEGGREPRHASVGVRAVCRLRGEHGEVGARARQHAVEHAVRTFERRNRGARGGAGAPRPPQRPEEPGVARRVLAVVAMNRHADGPALARAARARTRRGRCRASRASRKAQAARAPEAVHPVVQERHFRRVAHLRAQRAASRSRVPADFEQVGEIGIEVERETQARRARRVTGDREELIAARLPEELGASDVEGLLAQDELAVDEYVGVARSTSSVTLSVCTVEESISGRWPSIVKSSCERKRVS